MENFFIIIVFDGDQTIDFKKKCHVYSTLSLDVYLR